MYVNLERFKTKKELNHFIDKKAIHKDDILYIFYIDNEDIYLLIWY